MWQIYESRCGDLDLKKLAVIPDGTDETGKIVYRVRVLGRPNHERRMGEECLKAYYQPIGEEREEVG